MSPVIHLVQLLTASLCSQISNKKCVDSVYYNLKKLLKPSKSNDINFKEKKYFQSWFEHMQNYVYANILKGSKTICSKKILPIFSEQLRWSSYSKLTYIYKINCKKKLYFFWVLHSQYQYDIASAKSIFNSIAHCAIF